MSDTHDEHGEDGHDDHDEGHDEGHDDGHDTHEAHGHGAVEHGVAQTRSWIATLFDPRHQWGTRLAAAAAGAFALPYLDPISAAAASAIVAPTVKNAGANVGKWFYNTYWK